MALILSGLTDRELKQSLEDWKPFQIYDTYRLTIRRKLNGILIPQLSLFLVEFATVWFKVTLRSYSRRLRP